MVDSFGTPDATTGQSAEAAADGAAPRQGFLSTTVGKLVVGGIALVLILGAVAAVFFIFILNKASDEIPQPPVVVPVETTSTPDGEGEPVERPEVPLEDTFAFRNIFQPTIKITVASSDSDDGTDGTADGEIPDVPPDTLFLMSVSTVDGEPVAELIWNGQQYSLKEGESIPDTPWQVLSISGDTVVMLYGDARVTLTAGQGISK